MGTAEGEWSSILKTEPPTRGNTDGHLYFPDMGEALAAVLRSKPKYFLGMQRFAREETHPVEIEKFLVDNNLQDIEWVNADVWHHASIKGYFDQFLDALNERTVLLFGPAYLTESEWAAKWFPRTIPSKDCWLSRDSIIQQVREAIIEGEIENGVFLFCASMPANYMIDVLYKEFGDKHTFLDMGSVFDVYVNRVSRSYHKKVIERLKNEKL